MTDRFALLDEMLSKGIPHLSLHWSHNQFVSRGDCFWVAILQSKTDEVLDVFELLSEDHFDLLGGDMVFSKRYAGKIAPLINLASVLLNHAWVVSKRCCLARSWCVVTLRTNSSAHSRSSCCSWHSRWKIMPQDSNTEMLAWVTFGKILHEKVLYQASGWPGQRSFFAGGPTQEYSLLGVSAQSGSEEKKVAVAVTFCIIEIGMGWPVVWKWNEPIN